MDTGIAHCDIHFFLAILVTGGQFDALSADLISTNGTYICGLFRMPIYKYYHTQSGLTACGGSGSDAAGQNCLKFQEGKGYVDTRISTLFLIL